jgi:hypothetical protein
MSRKNTSKISIDVNEWEKNCNVLSLEIEAAWLKIVFKMFSNNKQSIYKLPTKGLQNLWRCNEQKVQEIIQELIDFNVCEIQQEDHFTIFKSSIFEKENNISKVRSEAVRSRKDRVKEQQSTNKDSTNDLQSVYKTSTKHSQKENDCMILFEDENLKEEREKVNYEEIKNVYHAVCINLPKIRDITEARKKALDARINQHGLELIGEVFQKASQSNFLNGKNNEGWKASFDWLLNPNNFQKVLENNYENKQNNTTYSKISQGFRDYIRQGMETI